MVLSHGVAVMITQRNPQRATSSTPGTESMLNNCRGRYSQFKTKSKAAHDRGEDRKRVGCLCLTSQEG